MASYRHRLAEFIEDTLNAAQPTSPLTNASIQFSNRENKLDGAELAPNNKVIIAVNKAQGEFYAEGCITTPGQIVANAKKVKVVIGFFLSLEKRKDAEHGQELHDATERVWEVGELIANAIFADMTLGSRVEDASPTKWFEDIDNIKTHVNAQLYLLVEINTAKAKFNR